MANTPFRLTIDPRHPLCKWLRFSGTAFLPLDLNLGEASSWSPSEGHGIACVRPWVLSPALPKANEQAKQKTLCPFYATLHPDWSLHSAAPARSLSNSRANPVSVAGGFSVAHLHICGTSALRASHLLCVRICAAPGIKPRASCKHFSLSSCSSF